MIDLSATSLLAKLQSGEVSSEEVTAAFLDRINAVESRVGAFLKVNSESAMQAAQAVDEKRSSGTPLGKLAGIPIAVKDILCTEGEATTCGSRMLEHYVPPYNATVIEHLLASDAIVIGRTNMDEFAMGSSTENSAYKPTCNPWDLERIPGGSSGGAAACLAAAMAPLSIGTDTGGSIRQPAALCGVVGLKPTYGRVSRFGLVAFASSLDQVGPMATTVEDTALLLETIAGHDRRDSTSAKIDVPQYTASVNSPLENLTIGVVPSHYQDGLDTEIESAVKEAIRVYESLGARIKEIQI